MKKNLFETFGHCKIPKGTLLFHGTSDGVVKDCMFFGLTFFVGSVFHSTVQVWRVKKDFDVLFLCESVGWVSRVYSSIPKLFDLLFPEERGKKYTDLDIKHFDHTRRERFANELHSNYNIRGWLSTVEENAELEICLLKKQSISNYLELIVVKQKGQDVFYKNSLRRIKLYPPQSFYDKSYSNLLKAAPRTSEKSDLWNKYRRFKRLCISEGNPSPEEIKLRREAYFDLRAKLKF